MAFKQVTKAEVEFNQKSHVMGEIYKTGPVFEQMATDRQAGKKDSWGMLPRELTPGEQGILSFYQKYKPILKKMVELSEVLKSSQTLVAHLNNEAENKPSRAAEIRTGLETAAAGVFSTTMQAPADIAVMIKEGKLGIANSDRIFTEQDIKDVLGEAGKYLSGKQTEAWTKMVNVVRELGPELQNFYAHYNALATAVWQGNDAKIAEMEQGMATTLHSLTTVYTELHSVRTEYKAQLEQFNGFTTEADKFGIQAATAITGEVVAAGVIAQIGKSAKVALPIVAEKVLRAVGAGAVPAARAVKAVEAGVVFAIRVENKRDAVMDVYDVGQQLNKIADQRTANVTIQPVKLD